MWVDLNHICAQVWPQPDPRSGSTSTSPSFWSSKNRTFLGLSPPPFWHVAQNWWLIMILWYLFCSLSEPNFRMLFWESYHVSSNFAEFRHFTKFKWPYFRTAAGYGRMVGHAGSPICIAHTDMTLTWSKVTQSLKTDTFWSSENLRTGWGYKLVIVIAGRPPQAVHALLLAAMTVSPLAGLFLLPGTYVY